jgi:hypothetical protein
LYYEITDCNIKRLNSIWIPRQVKIEKTTFSLGKAGKSIKKRHFLHYDWNCRQKAKKLAAFHSLLEGK